MTKSVLTKDLQKKQILEEFLQHCEQQQIEALQRMIPISFASGLKKLDWPEGNWWHSIVRKKSMMRNVHVFKGL